MSLRREVIKLPGNVSFCKSLLGKGCEEIVGVLLSCKN